MVVIPCYSEFFPHIITNFCGIFTNHHQPFFVDTSCIPPVSSLQESEYSMPLAQSFQRWRLGALLLEAWKMGRDIWLMRWLLGYVIRKCDINGIHMGYKWDITWIFMGKLQRPHVATSLEWLLVIIAQIAELCRSVNYYLPRHMIDGQLISPYFSIFDGYPLVN